MVGIVVVVDRGFEYRLCTLYYFGIIETWRCIILDLKYDIGRLTAFSFY